MLNRSTRLVVRKVCNWWPGLEWEEIKSENRIIFPDIRNDADEPSEIFFAHAQDADSLRAVEVAWFWIDEAALCREDAFLVAQGRIRQPGYPHRGWVTGTPKGQNWVYRRFVEDRDNWSAEKLVRYGFHTWATRENPLYEYEPEYLATLGDSYGLGTDFYRQEILGEFVAFAGLVYHLPSGTFVQEPPGLYDFVRIIAGVDWGVTAPGAIIVVGETRDGDHWLLDEVVQRGMVTHGNPGNDWASEAIRLQQEWGIDKFVADPSDANAILGWKQRGIRVEGANNARLEGVRQCQSIIAGGQFRVVEPSMPNWISESNQYHWKTDNDGNPLEDADPAKEFDHALDAWRYAEMELAGKQKRPARSYQG